MESKTLDLNCHAAAEATENVERIKEAAADIPDLKIGMNTEHQR